MTSLRMHVINAYLRGIEKPKMATPEAARRRMAQSSATSTPPGRLRKRHQVTRRTQQGFDCWTVAPTAGASTAALYLHGGAYISQMVIQHWALVSQLADAGVLVEVPIYGLAPHYTYRDAYPFVTDAYRILVEQFDASKVSIVGDSAGAGLALGLAQSLEESGLPQPARLVLMAPWLDLTLSGEGITAAAPRDPMLTPAGLIEAGAAWAGGDDPKRPRLSPIHGSLHALPPTDIYIGSRDLFLPDIRRLAQLAGDAAWPVTLIEAPGAPHAYPLLPAPEGSKARERIVTSLAGG